MLKISNLCKAFAANLDPIFSNFNLTIDKGEFCVVLGGNGSGKTTLLKSIIGECEIDSGAIYLGEKLISNMPIYARAEYISSVTQDISLGTIAEMNLLENIALGLMKNQNASLSFYSKYEQKITQIIKELDVGLEKYIHKQMGHLSGGQRQSIATLMAMLAETELLLLDEHTSALDPGAQEKLMSYTSNKIRQKKITALMVTHNINDAIKYGDRLVMLYKGRIILDVAGKEKKNIRKEDLLDLYSSSSNKICKNNDTIFRN